MNLDLANKTAVVCSSAQGIGLAAAKELANMVANLILVARNEALKLLKKDSSMTLPEHQTLRSVFIELSKKKNIWNYIS